MDATTLERLLRRTNPTITEERAALAAGRWEAYLRERVPPPSRLAFRRHRAWQEAYEHALKIGQASTPREGLVLPVWYGSNPDDVPERVWVAAIAVDFEDGSYQLYEDASLGGVIVVARLEEARIGFIMPSKFYAPDMKLPHRNQHYVAVESRRIERVVGIERVVSAPLLPEPAYAVAAFATEAEPAVKLDGLDEALAARARRLVDKLRVFVGS
jgi:hypothetical protein